MYGLLFELFLYQDGAWRAKGVLMAGPSEDEETEEMVSITTPKAP